MILSPGEKLLVVHRRLYEGDRPRFFIGTVERCDAAVARVTGYTWVIDRFNALPLRKDDPRTKVIALESTGLLIYVLPGPADPRDYRIETPSTGAMNLVLSSAHWSMDLSEVAHVPR